MLITHDFSKITEMTDRIAVLRLGRVIAHVHSKSTTQHEIISCITGASTGRFTEEGVTA